MGPGRGTVCLGVVTSAPERDAAVSRTIGFISLITVAMCVASCGSTSFTGTGPSYPPREPDCQIQTFTSPVQGYVEIGTIDVNMEAAGELVRLSDQV